MTDCPKCSSYEIEFVDTFVEPYIGMVKLYVCLNCGEEFTVPIEYGDK